MVKKAQNSKTKTSPQTPKSKRNVVAIIIPILIGILIITGGIIASLLLLPKTDLTGELNVAQSTNEETTANSTEANSNSATSAQPEEADDGTESPAPSDTEVSSNSGSSAQTTNSSTAPSASGSTTTTQTPTSSTTTTPTKPSSTSPNAVSTFIKTVTEDKSELVTSKFGTKIWRDIKLTYDLYSDGSKRNNVSSNYLRYDYSGYNATTAQLKTEANSLKSSEHSTINQVLALTNQLRAEKGLTPLQLSDDLTLVANFRAAESAWAGQFSHTRPNGTLCFTAGTELSIPFQGENMAYGSSGMSANTAVTMWRNSPGHYANIINNTYTKIGIGVATCGEKVYYVQVFAN